MYTEEAELSPIPYDDYHEDRATGRLVDISLTGNFF